MKEYLFSYGTLQNDEVQIELFGRILTGTSDILPGHKLSVIEITDERFLARGEQGHQLSATVSADWGDTIDGTVFELTGDELVRSDMYEPDGYERFEILLGSGKRAWVYRAAT